MIGRHRVEAEEFGRLHRVGVVGVAPPHEGHAATGFPLLGEIVARPQRGRMVGRVERHHIGRARRDGAHDAGVEIGVAGEDLPLVGETARDARPRALDAHRAVCGEGAVGVLRARVQFGDLEQRARQGQVAGEQVDLAADLESFVLLGRQRLRRAGGGDELLERRVERRAVGDVIGLPGLGLEDHAAADAGEGRRLIGEGQRGIARRVERIDGVADLGGENVVAQAADQLELGQKVDAVVDVTGNAFGIGRRQVAGAARRARIAVVGRQQRRAAGIAGQGVGALQGHAVAGAVAEEVLVVVAVEADLDAGQQGMLERPGIELGRQFRLVEERHVEDVAVVALLAHVEAAERQAGRRRQGRKDAVQDRADRLRRRFAGIGHDIVDLRLVAQRGVPEELVIDVHAQ